MDLSLTREQRAVRDAFAALFGKQATPQRVRAAEATGFDGLLWRHYAEVGRYRLGNRSPAELAGQPVRTVACRGSSHRGVSEHVEAMHSACVDMQLGRHRRPV